MVDLGPLNVYLKNKQRCPSKNCWQNAPKAKIQDGRPDILNLYIFASRHHIMACDLSFSMDLGSRNPFLTVLK